jgi:hypothetical protein
MIPAVPATWPCPRCQRRVPLREAACFCGCPREEAEREQRQQRQRSAAQPTRELVLMLVLVGLLGWVLVRQRPEPEPEPVPLATVRVRPPSPDLGDARPIPSATPLEPDSSPSATPLAAVPVPAAPALAAPAAPAPEATPASELARQELRSAYAALAPEAQRLERVLSDYQQRCLGSPVGVVIINCDQMQGWLTDSARRIQEGLATAEERARRSRALPGDVRALREELGVAGWEELAARALTAR